MTFQKITLLIASVLLILVLGLIAYMLYKAQSQVQFPPVVAQCPDYWTVSGEATCTNVQNIGSGCQSPMDFSGPQWQGSNGLQAKYNWAKSCGLTWQGVTNNSKFISTDGSIIPPSS